MFSINNPMYKTFYFDQKYRQASITDAAYWVEIDLKNFATFYSDKDGGSIVYQEALGHFENTAYLPSYLSIVLKSFTDDE